MAIITDKKIEEALWELIEETEAEEEECVREVAARFSVSQDRVQKIMDKLD